MEQIGKKSMMDDVFFFLVLFFFRKYLIKQGTYLIIFDLWFCWIFNSTCISSRPFSLGT